MSKNRKQNPSRQQTFWLILIIALAIFASGILLERRLGKKSASNNNDSGITPSCSEHVTRLQDFKFIKPLAFVDNECESSRLLGVKTKIINLIDEYKGSGSLVSASVYLKLFDNNDWIGINETDKYSPGSLMKVPVLITLFKMKEQNPGFFNLSLTYKHPFQFNKKQNIVAKQIQPGQSYTVRELIDYMISYSDNNATNLLDTIIDIDQFKKLFTDLGLPAPEWKSDVYPISPKDFSLIMRALYNSVYLSPEDSELATEILSHTQYKDGLLRELPENLQVAHKFGEGGYDSCPELSESAIFYLDNKIYLLTVMTKGADLHKEEELLGQISRTVFQGI